MAPRPVPAPALAAALAVLALFVGLAGCGRRHDGEPPLRAPAGGATVAERTRVLNADVFVIDGRHIRLAGAAAPQPIPYAKCWAEALAAKQATGAVRELVRSAGALRVQPTGAKDEFNREVARVFLDGQDLAGALHDQGLAAETASRRFDWCGPLSSGEAGAPDYRALMDFGQP